EPWVFINNAGYNYLRAGENLAYGFATSGDTISGWMNSPTHRNNMLDTAFVEVGFGFANSENFNDSGPETVVVAMYAKPQVLSAGSTVPAANQDPAPQTTQSADSASQPQASATTKETEVVPVAATTDL